MKIPSFCYQALPVLLLLAIAGPSPARATQVVLRPVVATDIRKAGSDGSLVSPPGGIALQVGSYRTLNPTTGASFTYMARSLLVFDPGQIPSGATIRSVSLRVCNAADRSSRPVMASLGLYALADAFAPTRATWEQSDKSGGTAWTTGAGAVGEGSVLLARVSASTTSNAPAVIEWSGPGLADYVLRQHAASSPVRLVIKADNETQLADGAAYRELFLLISNQHANISLHPQLIVNYD